MSSIRVPQDLLRRLHAAAPSGVSLPDLLRWLLQAQGGPEQVRAAIGAARRREVARAQVARLRRLGHRSVVLDPGQQETLADATVSYVRALERSGRRRRGPGRTLILTAGRPVTRSKEDIRKVRRSLLHD